MKDAENSLKPTVSAFQMMQHHFRKKVLFPPVFAPFLVPKWPFSSLFEKLHVIIGVGKGSKQA